MFVFITYLKPLVCEKYVLHQITFPKKDLILGPSPAATGPSWFGIAVLLDHGMGLILKSTLYSLVGQAITLLKWGDAGSLLFYIMCSVLYSFFTIFGA